MISGDSEYRVTATPGNERCDEQTVEVKVLLKIDIVSFNTVKY